MTVDDPELAAAHAAAIQNRPTLARSTVVGCFGCLATFPPSAITRWADGNRFPIQTGICPNCSVDALLGDAGGFPPTPEFLARMQAAYFARVLELRDRRDR